MQSKLGSVPMLSASSWEATKGWSLVIFPMYFHYCFTALKQQRSHSMMLTDLRNSFVFLIGDYQLLTFLKWLKSTQRLQRIMFIKMSSFFTHKLSVLITEQCRIIKITFWKSLSSWKTFTLEITLGISLSYLWCILGHLEIHAKLKTCECLRPRESNPSHFPVPSVFLMS